MTIEGPNFHEMVPNLKEYGMVSLKKIPIYFMDNFCQTLDLYNLFWGWWQKDQKLLGNCDEIPPHGVGGQLGFPTHVWTSKICKKNMWTDIRTHGLSLHMIISSSNWL